MEWDQWGPETLAADQARRARQAVVPKVPAAKNLVVEDATTGFTGAMIRLERVGGMIVVVLEDRRGATKSFPLGPGFLIDGQPVELVMPTKTKKPAEPGHRHARTASGSRQAPVTRAKVARASRIWVEGVHDAELVEKIWGDDLRVEGIVVQPQHGIDELAGAVEDFGPAPRRRLAVLLDHLVPGSKESAIAEQTMTLPGAQGNVLIVGHPYVDIWQAVKPQVIGRQQWPVIPKGQSWKAGILEWLGLPHKDAEDIGLGWKQILARVSNYADLEPALLAKVEQMIDFVTVEPA
ncbi:DUF3097 family protein [Auritidibacter ignavus]|uniref:DUF3097 family protein n=1 Tax=Auritidibacter ignavus TaxID=678932 RepID=UPI00244B7265|nr:DUF3097 family protein [Auritidibacter ignavus]WGH86781.1 DUF3097 family protein [Auritidibacter ignavus]WGH89067.1 DUF3097 family protein [Auritidibacter ignavus]